MSAAAALPAAGMVRVDPFQATVPVIDRSEAGQGAAFQAAMRTVLVRVTGRHGAQDDAALAPLLNNARRYVQQYRAAPDSKLWVAFDGTAIERWLTQNGQPLWGRDRPATLVWLTVQSGQSSSVLTAESTSDLRQAIDGAAEARGIPLIWPTAAVVASSSTAQPADVAHRLGADGVLNGHAAGATATAAVHWTFQYQDRTGDYVGATEGVNRAADLYAGLFAASGAVVPVDIDVTGIMDLHDYAGVQAYLESMTSITHVSVESLSGDTMRLRVTARGGAEPLAHAFALTGKLQPLPPGDNGIQRFQLRR